MITHDTATNTWSFTHGSQQYTGFASREQAAEALYDAERGQAPHSPLFLDLKSWIDAHFDAEPQPATDPNADEEEIIDIVSRLLQGHQPDPQSLPDGVGAIVYSIFAQCCAGIKQLNLPPDLIFDVLDPVATAIDRLSSPETVGALVVAWATAEREDQPC